MKQTLVCQLTQFLKTEILYHIDVTEREIADLLHIIDVNKASGPDGISGKILTEAGAAIVPSLTRIIKLSLDKAQYLNNGNKPMLSLSTKKKANIK